MKTRMILRFIGLLSAAFIAYGDVLELKNGTVLNGKYAGGTADIINFDANGLKAFPVGEVASLKLTPPTAQAASQTAAAPQPAAGAPAAGGAAPAGTKSVVLPAGTTLLVRVMDPVSSKSPPGTKFSTRLEYDLMAGNTPAVKAGTTIYGQVASSTQARRAVGKSTLDLRLNQISAGGTPIPITTSGFQEAGEASIRKAGRGAAAGAAIGAIAGDAGKGAAIGASVGAIRRGETVEVPSGALIEFTLTQPVTINQ